jgi:heat shock protein HtpX
MSTLYTQKDRNVRLTWVYLTGFFIFIIGVGWIFAQAMNNSFILYCCVFFAVLMSFISYWHSDKIVLSISGAKEVTRDNAKDVYNLVENLCITAGLPVPKIYIIPDSAPNAFATGRDAEHAVIALTSGIIDKLDKRELEGVIAHELSHIGNRDILLGTVLTVLVGFVALLSDWFLRWSIFGRRSSDGDNKMQLILTIVALVLAILAPIAAMMMKMAISRKREYLADADGALLTRFPQGLADALEKISGDDEILKKANKATAHMYIVNPLKGKRSKGLFTKMFMTHPPVEERIRKLKEMAI